MCPFILLIMIIAMMTIIIAIVIMMMINIAIMMIRGKRHSTPATLVWMDEHYHLVEGVCIPR